MPHRRKGKLDGMVAVQVVLDTAFYKTYLAQYARSRP